MNEFSDKSVEHVDSVEGSPDPFNLMDLDIDKPFEFKMKPRYKHLVLSGGSVRGISHLGVLHMLFKHNLIDIDNLQTVVGVSVGAIIGCMLILKFTVDEIWDFILSIDIQKLIHLDSGLTRLIRKCGMDSGKIMYKLIEDIIYAKAGIHNVTFKDLFNLTGIHFIVVGSCLTTKKAVYFDHVKNPTFVVSVAIRISFGIPGLFTPVDIDGEKYIDGSFIDNFPMHLFEDKLEETIGILISHEYDTNYKCVEQFFMAVMNLFLYQFYHATVSKYPHNTIFIDNNIEKISMLDFTISDDTKHKLFKEGMIAAQKFIDANWEVTVVNEDFDDDSDIEEASST